MQTLTLVLDQGGGSATKRKAGVEMCTCGLLGRKWCCASAAFLMVKNVTSSSLEMLGVEGNRCDQF